jgi:hypothetical protein
MMAIFIANNRAVNQADFLPQPPLQGASDHKGHQDFFVIFVLFVVNVFRSTAYLA